MDKVDLPNVTVELIDTHCPELARLSMRDTLAQINPGKAIIFSPVEIKIDGVEWVEIPQFDSIGTYANFLWYGMWKYIRTSHVLLTQWDSWVIDGSQWTDEFVQYDYTGAPWWYNDYNNVGNGAGLRSMGLMNFLAQRRDEFPLAAMAGNEDHLLSRIYRTRLEGHGFRWAPEQLASRLSFECTRPSSDSKHFMFHDAFNFPAVLDPDRLAERIALMGRYSSAARKLPELRAGRKALIMTRLAGPEHARVPASA